MNILESLKKAFTYSGNKNKIDEVESNKSDKHNRFIQKHRINVGDPLQRIKDVKDEVINVVKNSKKPTTRILTKYTTYLVYGSYHKKVESIVKRGKPLEEARILYKRFLEDRVTDEFMYSNEDLEYIQNLIRHMKEISNSSIPDNVTKESLIKQISNHKKFLNIVEFIDIKYGYDIMDFLCDRCYIICGYYYLNKELTSENLFPIKLPHFHLNINDHTFILLNEVKSIICNEDSIQDKEEYVIKKLAPFFGRYVILNEVPDKILFDVLTIFDNLDLESNTSNSKPDILKEKEIEYSEEEDATEKVVQKKIFENIEKEVNPINSLEKDDKFLNLYSPLADPRNPDVSVEDLEEAIQDINQMVNDESYELSIQEFKVFSTIKRRLSIIKGGGI